MVQDEKSLNLYLALTIDPVIKVQSMPVDQSPINLQKYMADLYVTIANVPRTDPKIAVGRKGTTVPQAAVQAGGDDVHPIQPLVNITDIDDDDVFVVND